MQKLIEFILKRLVSHPDDVVVTIEENEADINVSFKVNPEDAGRVIGKQGRMINSIRSLGKVLAMKNRKRVNLRLVEE